MKYVMLHIERFIYFMPILCSIAMIRPTETRW